MPNKIHVGGPAGETHEGKAGEAMTPGHLVERSATGDGITADTYVKHATDAGPASAQFLVEDAMSGDAEDDLNPIDDAKTTGEWVKTKRFPSGARIYPLIAANENVSDGDYLVSNGDGTLRVYSTTTPDDAEGAVLAKAREGATDTAAFRCEVEIL